MKKTWTALAALLMVAVLAACSAKTTSSPSTTAAQDGTGTTYTGTLQEKKDFMIVVGEDGSDGKPGVSYTFDLGDNTKVDAKVGDKVTVTYTGDLNNIDSTLTATKVESAS